MAPQRPALWVVSAAALGLFAVAAVEIIDDVSQSSVPDAANQASGDLTRTPTTVMPSSAPTVTSAATDVATSTPSTAGPSTAGPSTAGPSTAGPSTAASPSVPAPAVESSGTVPSGVQFIETFDSPESLLRLRWELADGRPSHAHEGLVWEADHDHDCQGVDTSRTLSGPPLADATLAPWTVSDVPAYWDAVDTGVVYWCREHVMSSYNTEGYAHLDFSPNQQFSDVQRVCWDINATDLGGRKWIEVVVVPESVFQQNGERLDYVNPGFAPDGPGFWGVAVDSTIAMLTVQQGRVVGHGMLSGDAYAVLQGNVDKKARLSTCLHADGLVEQELPDGSMRETRLAGSLPTGPVRVIFADVSYNPDKAVGESPPAVTSPYTWHWDNIVIS